MYLYFTHMWVIAYFVAMVTTAGLCEERTEVEDRVVVGVAEAGGEAGAVGAASNASHREGEEAEAGVEGGEEEGGEQETEHLSRREETKRAPQEAPTPNLRQSLSERDSLVGTCRARGEPAPKRRTRPLSHPRRRDMLTHPSLPASHLYQNYQTFRTSCCHGYM